MRVDVQGSALTTSGYRPGTSNPNVLPPVILHAGDRFDFSSGDLRRHGDTVVSQLKVILSDRTVTKLMGSD